MRRRPRPPRLHPRGLTRAAALAAGLVAVLEGCGAATGAEGMRAEAAASAPPRLPPTDGDPLPHTPEPTVAPRAGSPASAELAGGAARARTLALSALDALARRDEAALGALLADRIVRLQPRLGAGVRPRDDVLRELLDPRRNPPRGPAPSFDQLVRLQGVVVERVSERFPDPDPTGLIRPDDMAVTAPFLPAGRRVLGTATRTWSVAALLIVRPGGDGRVVGL